MRRPQLTYANVMSTLAAFLALGGTSYAVARNSVGNRELKNDAVTSLKVKNGSLSSKDLSVAARSVRGQRGPAGPSGATGPAGPAGPGAPAAEAWKALPVANGWSNYGSNFETAAYRKDPFGVVHLRGLVTRASGAPSGPIVTLPPGYRPQRRRVFVVATGGGLQAGRLDMQPNGVLAWLSGATAEPDFTSLEAISFDGG
jgi:hypothetical protein